MAIFNGSLHQVINGSIIKFAAKRGIELEVDAESESVLFHEVDSCEHMFAYGIGNDGSLIWRGNVYLPADVKEELPAHIMTEAKLKEVIEFIYTSVIKK